MTTIRKKLKKKSPLFFYSHKDTNTGYLSQFYPSTFTYRHRTYNCCEQWMMSWKARLFKDRKTLELIMLETNPTRLKHLGRCVKNFDNVKWMKYRFSIVKKGNFLKFSQNKNLAHKLQATKLRELVEATPFDRIWAIGCSVTAAPNYPRDKWGQNLLGEALMSVRKSLFESKN
jgi:hypothetical protein